MYPVVGPSVRDPRLHVAAVIVSIHVLGQVALGFAVSVPQILAAIGASFAIEGSWTFVREQRLVWPGSAMLTGSGVALILRVRGVEAGDHWTVRSWSVFAAVAGLSLATKYLIRYRGQHVFNPSNLGLVACFLVLGSDRVEPLDFWWGPFDAWLLLAYVLIVGGGLLISRRLGTAVLALAFWATLAVGLAVLSAPGHCITSPSSLSPVCGASYWWLVISSPETLVFMFFMINDPKTVPAGGRNRVIFGMAVAGLCTLLMAPQTTEFATKVGLLGGLTLVSALRPITATTLAGRPPPLAGSDPGVVRQRRILVTSASTVLALGLSLMIVVAGASARDPERVVVTGLPSAVGVLPPVDPSSLPTVTVDPVAIEFDADMEGSGAQDLAAVLAWILEIEAEALRLGDPELVRAVESRGPTRPTPRSARAAGRGDSASSRAAAVPDVAPHDRAFGLAGRCPVGVRGHRRAHRAARRSIGCRLGRKRLDLCRAIRAPRCHGRSLVPGGGHRPRVRERAGMTPDADRGRFYQAESPLKAPSVCSSRGDSQHEPGR